MKENVVKAKSFAFALNVVTLYKFLQTQQREFVLSKQMLRSGTSIGAMIREAEQAESKADFIHKMAIAQKEANETEYWLDLLRQADYISLDQYRGTIGPNVELKRLLASILLTAKRNRTP